MIGTVSVPTPDPVLADRIRSAVPRDDEGAQTYLEVGARLDVVSAVHAEAGGVAWRSLHATWDRPWIIAMGQDPPAVARCVVALVDDGGMPEGITVERRAFTHLPARIRPVEHWEWDWWFTRSAPPVRAGPPLTEERRKNLVKQVKTMGENTKVSVRNARRDANEELKKLLKNGLPEDIEKESVEEVQHMTDEYIKKVDIIVVAKEKDIMTV